MRNLNQHSNHWIGNLTGSSDMWWREEEEAKKGKDVIALAGYRRAIANFVNIVTGRTDIPVTYNSNDASYTDGKAVFLSGNMNDKNFDPNVGLALHEGSHVAHTDFEVLQNLSTYLHKRYGDDSYQIKHKVQMLFNWVEDRRIDYIMFKSAPGYQNYYHAMYDKYFNFKIIDKGLRSTEHRDPTWSSYEFRIINFTNKNTDLDALPGLRKIYKMINLKRDWSKLDTNDCLRIAVNVWDEINKHIEDIVTSEESEGSESQENKSGGSSSGSGKNGQDDNSQSENLSEGEFDLKPNQSRSLENAISKQQSMLKDHPKKTKLAKADSAAVKTAEASGAYNVEGGDSGEFREFGRSKMHCTVIPKLTDDMVKASKDWRQSDMYPFLCNWNSAIDRQTVIVQQGIVLGKKLGKKLQVRNEERHTKWTRQESGRIDKRLIAELGFSNENIFKTTFVEKYNDAYMHISIDGSGSMNGENFENAIKSTVAVCQAASMVGNIHIQVSLRVTTSHRGKTGPVRPMIVIMYDSKANNMSHIKKYWKYVQTSGTTPEGLCFEAIEKQIIKESAGRDSFFVNYSDGQPYFTSKDYYYSGPSAYRHVKNQIDKFKANGIKVMSFFLSSYDWGNDSPSMGAFKKMYGQDAIQINPTQLVPLAKEFNKKFLQK